MEELEHGDHADDVEQAVGEGNIKKFRPAVEEAEQGEQQHGAGADGVGGLQAVKYRRAEGRPRQRQGDADEERQRGGRQHHALSSISVQRRSISLPARPAAPSAVSA